MVKTSERKVKNKQEERLRTTPHRGSSPCSSNSSIQGSIRKRSNRLSSTTTTTFHNNKTLNDDQLSIYSREENDQDLTLNKKTDQSESETDFITEKFNTKTPNKRNKRINRKKSHFKIDSDDSEQESDEEEEDHITEDLTLNKQQYPQQTNKFAQITHMGKQHCIDTFKTIDVITEETNALSLKNYLSNKQQINAQPAPELPVVNIELMNDYPNCLVDYKLPNNFIKYIETTVDELDEEIEYDMDEEDTIWLDLINEQRSQEDSIETKITQEQFEILMDRLEKESYFQSSGHSNKISLNTSTTNVNNTSTDLDLTINQTKTNNDSSSEDALCCICLDGECLNTNAILFCDMCNLAVHQECYGVPYIPEGQWLCRRCIQSPSTAVNCILCPNRYGAFKQTDRGLWCHVICAIWIPEVHFANTVFLEPVIGIENIDRARWKLMCYICRKKNAGACIQCDKNNCYTAFHVTCAQQAGLYMNINEELVDQKTNRKKNRKPNQNNSGNIELKRRAYCDIHTPIETLSPRTRKSIQSAYSGTECDEAMKRAQRMRMKKARKILAERRNAPPVVCMPVISKERCDEIVSKYLNIELKEKFFARLMNYWTLKRYSRNGVPILRRLQQAPGIKKKELDKSVTLVDDDDLENKKRLREQLVYWKKIRQDLETIRLLMELVRKRERMKRDCVRIEHLKSVYDLNSLNGIFLQRLLDILRDLDKKRIFHEPVDLTEVPSYAEVISKPMDFSSMQSKINRMEYDSFEQFEYDFELIIDNCCSFNQKNSHYYKAAVKLKEQAASVLKQSKRVYLNTYESPEEQVNEQNNADKLEIDIDSRRASICSSETLSSSTTEKTIKKRNKK